MSQIQQEKPHPIFYHPDIIKEDHRSRCIVCDLAYWLMKDIVKVALEEKA